MVEIYRKIERQIAKADPESADAVRAISALAEHFYRVGKLAEHVVLLPEEEEVFMIPLNKLAPIIKKH